MLIDLQSMLVQRVLTNYSAIFKGPIPAMAHKLSIIFVVDGKGLEAMSLLLIASLHKHHSATDDVEIIAYVTPNTLENLDEITHQLFKICKVRIEPLITDGVTWKREYPHGNKIIACAAPRDSVATIFLDTDIVCMQSLVDDDMDIENRVCVVPEGTPTWGKGNDRWERAYAHYDLPYPTDRVTLTRRRRIEYVPYFNAGFVAFPNKVIHDGKSFGALWLEMAIDFDWKCPVAQKRPWLDQVTLPLTIKRFGMEYQVLSESYNFSISDRDISEDFKEAKVVHYHRARFLEAAPQFTLARQWLDELIPDHPQRLTALLSNAGFYAPEPALKEE